MFFVFHENFQPKLLIMKNEWLLMVFSFLFSAHSICILGTYQLLLFETAKLHFQTYWLRISGWGVLFSIFSKHCRLLWYRTASGHVQKKSVSIADDSVFQTSCSTYLTNLAAYGKVLSGIPLGLIVVYTHNRGFPGGRIHLLILANTGATGLIPG